MNPKKLPYLTAAVLLSAVSPALAQEAASGSEATTTSSVVVEGPTNSGELSSGEELGTSSFFFPGGYGYLPETVSPGVGAFGRPPATFTFTLQGGYNDNIYSASKNSGVPKKGSWLTQATIGTDYLLAIERTYLALGANAGAVYYWDKPTSQVSPVGNLNLAFAHNFTPRLHFASRINAGYYSQPDLSLPNAPTRPNSGDYFALTSLFDLGYQWTSLFATTTTVGVNTQVFREGHSESNNYIEGLVGQAFRYKFAERFTGVAEVRGSKIWYRDSNHDSTTESILLGFDSQLTPRLNSTLRAGVSFRQFRLEGSKDATIPYVESVFGYRYGRGSIVQWSNRFGFEESNDPFVQYRTYRTSLLANHAITARISAILGVSYAYQDIDDVRSDVNDGYQHLISGNAGLQYVINRHFTVFANYVRNEVVADREGGSYTQNQYFLGASYQF